MRRTLLGVAATLAVLALSPPGEARAQVGGVGVGADPFSFYYGYYLPHQAYIAAQPRAIDTINQVVAQRQYAAATDRSALYDPISPYGGDEEVDPLRPFAGRQAGAVRPASPPNYAMGPAAGNTRGAGPALYYTRTSRYFPTLRTGRGPNANLAAHRRGGGGMGMPAMPSMPSMPGPR